MREFLTITGIIVLLIAAATGIVYALGGSFGLNLRDSMSLSILMVVCGLPGVVCLHIAVSPKDRGKIPRERIGNFIRGVGLLVVTIAGSIPMFSTVAASAVLSWAIGAGMALYFISLIF